MGKITLKLEDINQVVFYEQKFCNDKFNKIESQLEIYYELINNYDNNIDEFDLKFKNIFDKFNKFNEKIKNTTTHIELLTKGGMT